MNVTTDMSILSLIAGASVLVKGVMLLLAVVSFMSWYWIFRKWFAIRDAKKKTDLFERDFWSGGDLNALYQSAATGRQIRRKTPRRRCLDGSSPGAAGPPSDIALKNDVDRCCARSISERIRFDTCPTNDDPSWL